MWAIVLGSKASSVSAAKPAPTEQCKLFKLETLNVSLIESDHAFATLSDQNGHLAGLSDPFKKEKLFAVDE